MNETEINQPIRQLPEQTLLTTRVSSVYANDLRALQQPLNSSRKPQTFFGKFCRKIKRKFGWGKKAFQDNLSDVVREEAEALRAKHIRQMELIDDPIYMSALTQNKTSIQQFILKYSAVIKPVPPQNRWATVWNLVVMLVIMYYFFEIGLVIFFGEVVWEAELNAWWSYLFNFFAILVLIVDIFVTLNKGYYKQGILILDRKLIYRHYLRTHSIIDITGLLVVTMSFFSGTFVLNYIKVLFLLKLFNLNIIDLSFQRVLQFYRNYSTIYMVGRLIIIMVMCCHYLGGIFYAIDLYVYNTNYYGPNTPAWCWLYNSSAYSQIILNLPWILQYEYTMYWALATMTTIAYGDVTPLNPMETLYTIFMLIISCIIFAYILNGIIQILLEGKASESNFQRQFVTMNQFMKEKNIQQTLQIKIRAYFQFIWSEERYRDRDVQKQMIDKLPQQLKHELLKSVFSKFLDELLMRKYPYGEQFIDQVTDIIYEYKSSNNEILFQQGDYHPNQLSAYFLLKGKISFNFGYGIQLDTMQYGAFGLCQFCTQTPRKLQTRSVIDSLLYCLPLENFLRLVQSDQHSNETFRYMVDLMSGGREAEIFGLLCFICGEGRHLCKECPYGHYNVPVVALIKKAKLGKQKRLPVKRKNRTKEYNLLKQVKNFKRERDIYEHLDRQGSFKNQKNETGYISSAAAIFSELQITDTFNNLEQYLKETEILLKYMRDKILNDSEYPQDALGLDVLSEFEVYFPHMNPSKIIEKFADRPRGLI